MSASKLQSSSRYTDVEKETGKTPQPIEDYRGLPLVSIEEAVQSILPFCPDIERQIKIVKENCNEPYANLTIDETAAIHLYTSEWIPRTKCLYFVLNETLRSKERQQRIKPWHLYLKLFLTGLFKLDLCSDTIFRGVREDFRDRCVQGKKHTWWGFSSCTESMSVLQTEQFLGKSGKRTIFNIKCLTGRRICDVSAITDEHEILLLPGTQFIVESIFEPSEKDKDLVMIQLREIKPDIQLLQDPTSGKETRLVSRVLKSDGKPNISDSTTTASDPKFWLHLRFQRDNGEIIRPSQLAALLRDTHYPEKLNTAQLDRIKGSVFGLAMGDALSGPTKLLPHNHFQDNPVIDMSGGGRWNVNVGQFMDDTSTMLCLANSLIATGGFHIYDQMVRYKWWYKYGYMSSAGQLFYTDFHMKTSIERFEQQQKDFSSKNSISLDEMDSLKFTTQPSFHPEKNQVDAAGVGALVRLCPIPLFFRSNPQAAIKYSGESATLTHGNIQIQDACRYYGALIVAAVNGTPKKLLLDSQFYENHRAWFGSEPLSKEILKVSKGSFKNKAKGYYDGIRCTGNVVDCLEAAIWIFSVDESSVERGLLKAVNLGDDTNSIAAIYGQLAGAYYGYNKLPKKWLDVIYARKFFDCISEWIHYEGSKWFQDSNSYKNKKISFLADVPYFETSRTEKQGEPYTFDLPTRIKTPIQRSSGDQTSSNPSKSTIVRDFSDASMFKQYASPSFTHVGHYSNFSTDSLLK